jgi:hypothetical protein
MTNWLVQGQKITIFKFDIYLLMMTEKIFVVILRLLGHNRMGKTCAPKMFGFLRHPTAPLSRHVKVKKMYFFAVLLIRDTMFFWPQDRGSGSGIWDEHLGSFFRELRKVFWVENSVAEPGCLSRTPNPTFFHPVSTLKNLSILTQKIVFEALGNMIRAVHPGSGLLFFTHPRSRVQKGTGSGSATLVENT